MGIELACRLRFFVQAAGRMQSSTRILATDSQLVLWVDQVGAHVFATVDWFLSQSCGNRDGQQVLWLDVEGLCLPRELDVQ